MALVSGQTCFHRVRVLFHEKSITSPSLSPSPSSLPLPSGDVDSAVELLEDVYTKPGSTSPSMSFVFRKVLEEGNDEAVDKCKTHTHSHTQNCLCEDPRRLNEEDKHQKLHVGG